VPITHPLSELDHGGGPDSAVEMVVEQHFGRATKRIGRQRNGHGKTVSGCSSG